MNLFSIQYDASDPYSRGPIPEWRWAKYPSPEAGLARKLAMFARPGTTYNNPRRGTSLWASRKNPDAVIDQMVKGGYIIDEPGPGNSIAEWRARYNTGRDRYRRATGKGR